MVNLKNFDFAGRRALVTEEGDGLGREFTKALLDAGASVVITSKRKEFLQDVVLEMRKK